jgi:hypothetical protein
MLTLLRLIFVITILSLGVRFFALLQTQYANGWDSYFYLIQLKSWIETGSMHSPEASLIYPYMRVLHWFSNDYVFTYKLTSATLSAFFTFLILMLTRLWTNHQDKGKQFFLLLLIGLWTVFSPHLTYFSAQYPKNLLGINLFLGFVYFFPKNYPLAGLLLLLNFFGHRMTFGLSIIYAIFYFWNTYKGQFIDKIVLFLSKKYFFIGFVALIIGLGWMNQIFLGTFHFADLERLVEGFSTKIHFQFAPLSFWLDFDENERLTVWWKLELIACVLGFLWLLLTHLFNSKKNKNSKEVEFLQLGILLLLPFLPWSLTGISYRFFLVFILFCPLFLFFGLINVPDSFFQSKKIYPFVSVLLLMSLSSWQSYSPKKHDPDYAFYSTLTKAIQTKFVEKSMPELFIVHNALAEYFTYTTGIDALPWQPEYSIAPQKLWRIAGDVNMPELAYFAQKDSVFVQIYRLPGRYALMEEQIWQSIKQNAKKDSTLSLEEKNDFLQRAESWNNPFKIRPSFLLNKKKGK